MRFKAGDLLRHLPTMVKLGALTGWEEFQHLYHRAYWRKKGVHVEPTARLLYESDKMIELGWGSHIGLMTVLVADDPPAGESGSLLKVGERTWIGDQVNIRAVAGLVTIGSHCLIANGVTIISCTHGLDPDVHIRDQPLIRGDVHIGDDVWIGAGVMVMPGSTIGQGAVVGAGAVVKGTVEPYEIVVGIPAKSIGSRKNRG